MQSAPSRVDDAFAIVSSLVYGPDPAAVAALASGLALRARGSFRWVDCAQRPGPVDWSTRGFYSRGSPRPEVDRVDPELLRAPLVAPATIREVVVSSSATEERRLTTFLSLPELFQRLGARTRDDLRPVSALLANIDHLPGNDGAVLLGQRSFHELLHQAGIELISTTADPPNAAVRAANDRVFRVEVPDGERWVGGLVWEEKPPVAGPLVKPRSVREAWLEWQLDPTLLPVA